MMRMSMMVGSASRAPDSGKQVASVSQAVAFQCHSKRLFVFDRETKQDKRILVITMKICYKVKTLVYKCKTV